MKIYLVGGAVRDQLLGFKSTDRDWVVVGGTAEYFLANGYQQVGKDFPVFLHPKTNEEYALARVERKVGAGHKGFVCYAAPTVTLEQDLSRRDLTINAMAMDDTGAIIDPFAGQADCKDKILRHVSPAFAEDPLRCLRLARFAAQLTDFKVAHETLKLCQLMVQRGDLLTLAKPRIWQEWHKALLTSNPSRFFTVMSQMGALPSICPIDFSGIAKDSVLRFGLLASHVKDLEAILDLVEPPKQHQLLARSCYNILQYQPPQDAESWLKVFEQLDAFRRPEHFKAWLLVVSAAKTYQAWSVNTARLLFAELQKIAVNDIIMQGFKGAAIGEKLRCVRLAKISTVLSKVE